jgi:hypothetical protein
METTTQNTITWTRVKNDINGNGRLVCHFLNLIKEGDEQQIKEDFAASLEINPFRLTEFKYDLALSRAKKIGGKKFHNKQYGGGIVFQASSPKEIEPHINELLNSVK